MVRRQTDPINRFTIDTSYTEIFPIDNDDSRLYEKLIGRFREIDNFILKGFGRRVKVDMDIYTEYSKNSFTKEFDLTQDLLNAVGGRSIYTLIESALLPESILPKDIEYRIVEVNF